MKKNDIDINSILEEYKMSMGGYFFSNKDGSQDNGEQKLIEEAIESHLFDPQMLLITYDKLSPNKKRELFYRALFSLLESIKKK